MAANMPCAEHPTSRLRSGHVHEPDAPYGPNLRITANRTMPSLFSTL